MAVRTISTKLAIDGETQYKKAISDCNGALSSLKSYLSLVESEFRNNANSMEALAAKSSALDAVYEKQKEKVSALEKALSNAQQHQVAYADLAAEAGEKVAEYSAELEKLKDSTEDTQQKQAELTAEIEKWGAVQADAENASRSAEKSVQEWQKQLNNAKIGLNDLSDEISRNNQYMAEAEDSADQCAQSIDSFGKEVKDAGEASERFGSQSSGAVDALAQALVAAGVAEKVKDIAAALYDCVDTFAAFQSQMSAIQAISGATGADMAALAEKAKYMGSTTSFTAAEAGQAMEYMAMAGWKTSDMLDGLEGIMHLAAASGESLASTSDIVTDALTAFGLTASDSGHFADVLAMASSSANTNVGMMGETFKYAAPVAGALGYSIEDVAVAVGLMANASIKGSSAGTALRSTLTNLAKPSNEVAAYMELLGVSLTDDQGKMRSLSELIGILRDRFAELTETQQAEYAAGIAGKEAMSGLLAIVNASEEDYQNLTEAIKECNNAAYDMSQTKLDNYAGQVTLLNSAIDGLKLTVGEQLEPLLSGIASGATTAVSGLNELLEACPWLSAVLTGLVVSVGALTAAMAGLSIVKAITPMITAFTAALSATPLGAAATAMTLFSTAALGVVTALATLTAQGESADAGIKTLTSSIKDSRQAYQELVDAMASQKSTVADTIRALQDLLTNDSKSEAQKAVILQMVEELNQAIPDLSLSYDAASDSINMTADALERVAGAFEDQTENEAQIERLSELYEERSAITRELADAQAKLDEALANAQWDSFGGAMNDAAVDVEQLRSGMDALTSAQADNAAQIAALEEATVSYSQRQAESAAQTQEMTSRTEEISARTESLVAEIETLEAAYAESYNAAMESINGQMGLFQEMDGSAKTSIDSLIDTLKGQVAYMDSYSKNIQKAMELGVDEGLIRKLSDGSEKSAQILDAIVQGGTEDIAALNEQLSMVEKGKESFSGTVANMEAEFDKKMSALVKDLQDAVKDMNLKDDAYKAGWNNIQGLIEGTDAQKGALIRKYAEMGKAALAAYKREVQQASPSKAFQETGKFDIQGLIGGAESMKGKLANMYAGIAKAAKKVMEENLPSVHLDSEIISYDPSVDYSALMQNAKSRAEFDALAAQREAKIAGEQIDLVEKGYLDNLQLLEQWKEAMAESESKAKETLSFITEHVGVEMRKMIDGAPGMGQDFVDGLIEGIERKSEALNQSVQRMVQDMKACIDAEFQPVQEHLSNLLTDLADKSGAMYREDRSAYMQDIASTLRDALDGLSVNMSQRKVGELVTSWQKNNSRSRGV